MSDQKLGAVLRLMHVEPSDLNRDESFGLRMRVQRVVYLLQHTGEEGLRFSFSTYFRGPYSVDLAKACSLLGDAGSGSLKGESLAAWFLDHDLEWLSTATTVIMLHGSFRDRPAEEYAAVRFYRQDLTEEEFGSILSQLREKGVL